MIIITGFAQSGDDFTQFSTVYQWFQTLIHPAVIQPLITLKSYKFFYDYTKLFISSATPRTDSLRTC
ncbi:MAG: hypothetical protein HRU34_23050 [Richelia sp.]|nr:hypothetical protein [Richelia sp.]